jgi:hypothetical protein
MAQATPTVRPAADTLMPKSPVAPVPAAMPEKDLVIRATSPTPSDSPFNAADAHHPAAPPPSPVPEPGAPKANDELERVRVTLEQALAKDATIQDYVCRFRRREVVRNKPQPEDVLLFRHLKSPNSIYFKWLPGTQNEGRELIYAAGRFGNQLQVRTGKGDILAGIRTEIDPRSERATANCRRTIDEAGLPAMLQRLTAVLASQQQGKTPSVLHHLGAQQRPESRVPMECIAQRVLPGHEKHLPLGGMRYWFFCADPHSPEQGLPTLVITLDDNRRELEYYCFDQFKVNVGLRAEDFEPDAVWGRR